MKDLEKYYKKIISFEKTLKKFIENCNAEKGNKERLKWVTERVSFAKNKRKQSSSNQCNIKYLEEIKIVLQLIDSLIKQKMTYSQFIHQLSEIFKKLDSCSFKNQLDEFLSSCPSRLAKRIEKRQNQIEERKRTIKDYESRIDKLDEKIRASEKDESKVNDFNREKQAFLEDLSSIKEEIEEIQCQIKAILEDKEQPSLNHDFFMFLSRRNSISDEVDFPLKSIRNRNVLFKINKQIAKEKAKKHQRNIEYRWYLARFEDELGAEQLKFLEEFKVCLQASVSSLLITIQTITGPYGELKTTGAADLIERILELPLAHFCGDKSKKILSPISYFFSRKKILSRLQQLSQYLNTTKTIDSISEGFSSVVTAYFKSEIIISSNNPTVVSRWMQYLYDFCTSRRFMDWFKEQYIERYITGVNEKEKETSLDYKQHWPVLIAYIIANFLANVSKLEFKDFKKNRIAYKLANAITPISDDALHFNPTIKKFDFVNAYTLSRLALLAYESERKIAELAYLWGFKIEENNNESSSGVFKFFLKKDSQAFILADETKIIICFRGTDTFINVFNDLNFDLTSEKNESMSWQKDTDKSNGNVELCEFSRDGTYDISELEYHFGFKCTLDIIWPEIDIFINWYFDYLYKQGKSIPSVWLTGHSLGGACAVIAASYLKQRSKIDLDVHLYTFGQPRCGTQKLAEFLNSTIKDYQRFVNYLDPITSLPPRFIGFENAGQIRWFDFKGKLHGHLAYERKRAEKDKYGKEKIRKNTINQARHPENHSMVSYYENLKGIPFFAEKLHTCSYAELAHKQFLQANKQFLIETNKPEPLNTATLGYGEESSISFLFEQSKDHLVFLAKDRLSEAKELYAKGKAAYYSASVESSIQFFQQAKDAYKDLLAENQLEERNKKKAENRVNKIKEGVYSPKNIASLKK